MRHRCWKHVTVCEAFIDSAGRWTTLLHNHVNHLSTFARAKVAFIFEHFRKQEYEFAIDACYDLSYLP